MNARLTRPDERKGASRARRAAFVVAGTALWLFVLGFVVFATSVTRSPPREIVDADGIVVLTGGDIRITEAARLLGERRGARLLISGVNPRTGRAVLQRLSGLDPAQFNCCVDLDYRALDTTGNAVETQRWAETFKYDSLIIVTASYHMPRSLVELSRVMPQARLIPHAVVPTELRRKVWWLDPKATRLLFSEYLKLLPASARLVATRVVGPWQGSSMTASASSRARS